MLKKTTLFLILGLLFTSCTTKETRPFTNGTVESVKIQSTAFDGNLIKDSGKKIINIYLPGSYIDSEEKYPVIYYLAGFGGGAGEFFSAAGSSIDSAIKNGTIRDCIIVGISGMNNLGGSFYVNSPVTGNWEDFILEVVNYIDSNYRTDASPESRGIAGYSMGGFGSVNIGLRNADVFGYVYAFSPGVFGESGFDEEVWSTWKQWNSVLYSYGAAFDPDTTANEIPYSNTPKTTLTAEEAVKGWSDRWSYGYGDAEGKIEYYNSRNVPLLGIKIDYAEKDYFTWLIDGSKYFYNKLMEAGVNAEQEVILDQTHSIDSRVVKNYILPYFGEAFK